MTAESDDSDITDAVPEAHAVLEAAGRTYANVAINGRYFPFVDLIIAEVAAVAQ